MRVQHSHTVYACVCKRVCMCVFKAIPYSFAFAILLFVCEIQFMELEFVELESHNNSKLIYRIQKLVLEIKGSIPIPTLGIDVPKHTIGGINNISIAN